MIKRKKLRLKGYDYSQSGCYFITICTHDRIDYFGKINNGEMVLNQYGKIAFEMWKGLPKIFPNILLDENIVMPNHLHGIIAIIQEYPVRNASEPEGKHKKIYNNRTQIGAAEINDEMRSLQKPYDRTKMLIPKIVQIFKSEVTRRIKRISKGKIINTVWQKSYYDRVIRNEKEFENIQAYIHYNPVKWEWDIENKSSKSRNRENYYKNIISGKNL